ncbi:hypothetical protein [Yoonia sp.]|uniref:hypothetical protein n=1 Tax=Yoonia sp. TaxID=2212373 RepID=UPI0019DED40A|nr:hypothetical protein [Yoonia sp.]MBE0413807.1 hypothetical protein [Yoonia sp.]
MAQRIRARAIRRAGELLKQIEPAPNQHVAGMGAHTSRSDAARDAGMSKHQQVQATRLANIREQEFEAQVDSPKPPTLSQLAAQGTKPRGADGAEKLTRRNLSVKIRLFYNGGYCGGYIFDLQESLLKTYT